MKVITPEISWHERDPIYSVDFQPGNHAIQRVASGGVDKIVRIWQMTLDSEEKGNIEFLSNLRRHTATVNVVRFSKNGELLASAGDDSSIILWKLSDVSTPANNIFAEEDTEESKESWVCHKTLRGHLGDVADMSWSKDSRYLVSGSVDNSAIVWDVKKAQKMAFFNEHKSYVQGVAFDPLGDYIATLSSDRSLRIFSLASKNTLNNVSKMPAIAVDGQTQSDTKPKSTRIFHDDSLRSFFRRLEFTADGQLLLTPAGCVELGDKVVSSSFVFVRGAFARPALYLPSGDKSTTVVRANPQLFELRKSCISQDTPPENQNESEKHRSVFNLPYRTVFAVATEDSVLLYDTQQKMPVGMMKNIHYHQISDLSWSPDGKALIIASTDGFCTIATFEHGELGVPYRGERDSSDGETLETPTSDTQINAKETPDDSLEEKEQTTEIPFTRYSDTGQKSDKDSKGGGEVNTKLNVRRVSKSPATPGSKSPEDKNNGKGASQVKSPAGSKDRSKSSLGESSKAKGINTSLNIRRVTKSASSPCTPKTEDKGSPQSKGTSSSPTDSKKDPKINTVLNIRRVGKDGKSQSASAAAGKKSPQAEGKSSPVQEGKKESTVNTELNIERNGKDESSQQAEKEGEQTKKITTNIGEEKESTKVNTALNIRRVRKNENSNGNSKNGDSVEPSCLVDKKVKKDEEKVETGIGKETSSTLPDKVKAIHIEDVVMKEDNRESERESKNGSVSVAEEETLQIEDVAMD